jgi:phosphopantothenoylcysteine decarboxylase/phosphopantothenate--cysteine ligase
MQVLVTCGPASAPVDAVRRLTNHSTGALGAALADALVAAGHAVTCFRGLGATAPPPGAGVPVEAFFTNDDLAAALARRAGPDVGAVLHAAALTDFTVARVTDEAGRPPAAGKLASRGGALRLELAPAPKLLPRLRGWFPRARIAGWKYEVDGGLDAAFAAAARQFTESGVDACVVNGPAHGSGFTVVDAAGRRAPLPDAAALARWFTAWLAPAPA